MERLSIALQKSGRLSEKSLQLFKDCGIKLTNEDRKLKAFSKNFPLEVLFLRDDDIPQYVEQGVADIGIVGENEVLEQGKSVIITEKLGFANCRLSLAIKKEEQFTCVEDFQNKRIATSYPNILRRFFSERGIEVEIEVLGGSVELAPSIGLSDAILDIVSTGSTLMMNGLKEVLTVMESEAVLIQTPNLSPEKTELLQKLLFRIHAVRNANEHKYILLNAPNEILPEIIALLPGMKSPTILPLATEGWSSLHSVIKEDQFWDIIDQLKIKGAQGILVCPIEKMIL